MSLKRQTMWSMLPLIVVSAVNIFSVPLFLRYLGEEMYALAFYVMVFTGMFGFADLGLGIAVTRYVGVALGKGDHEAVREYWGTGNLIALPLLGMMGLMFAALGVFFGPFWFDKVGPENLGLLRALFIAGGFSLFVNYYAHLWNVLLQAHLDFRFTNLLRTISGLLQVVPAIWIAWWTGNPLWVSVWALIVGFLHLAVLVSHARRNHRIGLDLRFARLARAKEMAVYTGKTFVSLVVNSTFGSIDRLILSKLLPPGAQFTYYAISSNVGMRLQGLGVAVMGPVFHNTNRAVGGGRELTMARIFDEMFTFLLQWYLLAAVWVAVWHPVLLRLWLGQDKGSQVAPLFAPIIAAYCINAMASVSSSQLSALNRVGTSVGFMIAAGGLAVAGVWIGWQVDGVVGVAWGFLASRVAWIAQDIYASRLVKARGWLSAQTWMTIGAQWSTGGVFALSYLIWPKNSLWHLLPAALHGGGMVAWYLRRPLGALVNRLRGSSARENVGVVEPMKAGKTARGGPVPGVTVANSADDTNN